MDGNTRCVEVFMVKYLRNFGFKIDNDLYKRYALYYRNALVRSCYSNDGLNISSTDDYLIRFYHNLLMNTNYKLQSRDLIVEELYNPKIKMLIK
jgi:fido (protein-threonine AMPylation protein)